MPLKRGIRKLKKLLIVIGIILIVIILYLLLKPSKITFEKGFHDMLKLDDRYNASFKFERLNQTMVDVDKIDLFIKDLEEFKEKLLKYENKSDIQALNLLLNARINMLRSEKYFFLGRNIGDIGISAGGFRCSEAPYLINAAYYYNNSYKYGIQAYSQLDDLLNIYKDVPNLKKLVGIDETKVKFYASPIFNAKAIAEINIGALSRYCNYDKNKPLIPVIIK